MSEPIYKGPKYPTEAHGSIRAFNSYEEVAEFWDTHDFTDFKAEPAKVVATRGLSAHVQVRFELENRPRTGSDCTRAREEKIYPDQNVGVRPLTPGARSPRLIETGNAGTWME